MIHIITKAYCPYCSAAKKFLDDMGKVYKEIEVSNDPEEYEKYKSISGMRTVPQIFDGDISPENIIGGYDEMTSQYTEGKIFQ